MPTYDYLCPDCGPFTAFRPMAEFQAPQPCAGCGEGAPRATLTAPRLAGMDAARRNAFATNERSANAPRKAHPAACGCCRGPAAATKTAQPKRPWMLSH